MLNVARDTRRNSQELIQSPRGFANQYNDNSRSAAAEFHAQVYRLQSLGSELRDLRDSIERVDTARGGHDHLHPMGDEVTRGSQIDGSEPSSLLNVNRNSHSSHQALAASLREFR